MVADTELSAGVGGPHLPGDYVFSLELLKLIREYIPTP